MNECKIYLNKTEEDRIRLGHAWVFNNEVNRIEGQIKSGDIVSVFTHNAEFLGQGFLNTHSKIFVRLLSRNEIEIDEEFFRSKLIKANEKRIETGFNKTYRAFFAEADGIPGLIVDKYDDYLSVQILSLGVEIRKDMFIKLLVEIFCPKGIYERSDVSQRVKEGLELTQGILYGEVPDKIFIKEGDLQFAIDIKTGQKTGAFLDQSANHLAIIPYAKNKIVLDCFSHIGNFALQAKHAGAKKVIAVDISKEACDRIGENARINKLDIDVVEADVFKYLREAQTLGDKFDMIILDPPAFTKTRTKLAQAIKGYKEINLQAMKLLSDGGFLVSASCSHYLSLENFLEVLTEAASDAKKQVQLCELKVQASDHPALLGSEETMYLKFLILRVNDI